MLRCQLLIVCELSEPPPHPLRAVVVLCEYADSEALAALRLVMAGVYSERSNHPRPRAPIAFAIGSVMHLVCYDCDA